MPKLIESMKKHYQEADPILTERRKKISIFPISIALILALFFSQAWIDCSTKMATMDTSLAEKSKLCLVQYTQKMCDTIKPVGECKNLYKCISERDQWQSNKLWEWWEFFCQQILSEFWFPTVIIGLLLLMQVSNSLKKEPFKIQYE